MALCETWGRKMRAEGKQESTGGDAMDDGKWREGWMGESVGRASVQFI